jgi:hypothetical protein
MMDSLLRTTATNLTSLYTDLTVFFLHKILKIQFSDVSYIKIYFLNALTVVTYGAIHRS